MRKRTGLALLLMLAWISAPGQSLTIIELKNRTADELIPTVRPLLETGDYLTGKDYELYLKAGPATVQTVRDLVERLDRQAAQLLISVTTEHALEQQRSGYSVSGSVGRDNIGIRTGGQRGDNGISIQARESATNRNTVTTPQVRATEGRPAFIQQGLSVPVKVIDRQRINNRIVERERLEYHAVPSGFYVTARVNGDNVLVEIEQNNDSLQPGGAVNTARLNTSVRGRLGEWLPLGSVGTQQNRSESGIASRRSIRRTGDYNVLIKVEKVDSRN